MGISFHHQWGADWLFVEWTWQGSVIACLQRAPLAALLYDLALLQDQVKEKHGKSYFKAYLQIGCFLTLSVYTHKAHSIGVVLYRGCWKGSCVGCAEKNVMAYDIAGFGGLNFFFLGYLEWSSS